MNSELTCSNCGAPEREESGVVMPCECGSRKFTVPTCYNCGQPSTITEGGAVVLACPRCGSGNLRLPPKLPGMNWQERARRAECLLQRMAHDGNFLLVAFRAAGLAEKAPKIAGDFSAALDSYASHLQSLKEQGAQHE